MNDSMSAMRIHHLGVLNEKFTGLRMDTIPIPSPAKGEVLIRVSVCGVCHTELDEIENRSPPAVLPMTPGHQAVGTVVAEGDGCRQCLFGKTVGVAWIYSACGRCRYCLDGSENLCPAFIASGRDRAGGYAEFMTIPETFVHEIPASLADSAAAPLLCAGAVGYRALRMAGLNDGQALGLTGFGASGQLVLQVARKLYPKSRVHVFARSAVERKLAIELGAAWTGDTAESPPEPLEAVIDTTPAWLPVLSALSVLNPGGRLVINAIRKESGDLDQLAKLDFERHLWREKRIQTVANVTRSDVRAILQLAEEMPLHSAITEYPLERALDALMAIRGGNIQGAGVLRIFPAGS